MRADDRRRRAGRAVSLATLALLCACFAVAIGDDVPSLTVTNRTTHLVRVVIADRTFAAVAPGAQVRYLHSGPATIPATVSYLAGQGVQGSVTRTFQFVGGSTTTSTTTVYFACSTGGVVAPLVPSTLTWAVTADTLATR
ncbi:MAG TPA: hypothetical protein VLV15_11005 [Dongiaceae bacterium]|nr:hypothetical protein [Dongiaceae bacterium]